MEISDDNYSSEEEVHYPPTQETNADSTLEKQKTVNFKKWINSKSEISNISSIINLEIDTSVEKESLIEENAKNNRIEENDDKKEEEDNLNKKEKSSSEETREDSNNIKKNFTFSWDEGGSDVKITGSFFDWKIKFNMTKDPNDNTFKCQLPLENKIYQFKFIIDNDWKCSNKYPMEPDGYGNMNNIIDLTNYIEKREEQIENKENKSKPKNEKNLENKENKENKINTKDNKINIDNNNNNQQIQRKRSLYSCQFPSDDSIIPFPLPNKRYFQSFKLDKYSHQNSIGNNKYYSYNERYSFSHETSSKPIFLLGHVHLNHFISSKNKKMVIKKNCMSFRFRRKACTFLYYK